MSKRFRADIALAVSALIWALTFVIVKSALANASVFVFLAVRFSLAVILMLAVQARSLRTINRKAVWAGAQNGIFMFGGFAFQTAGLKYTTPSKTAFITGSCIVLVPILLGIFGGRRIARAVWAGAVLAFAGLYLLTVPQAGLGSLNRGDVLAFICAVMVALHIICIGRYARQYPTGVLNFLQIATTAMLAWIAVPLSAAAGWEAPRFILSDGLILAILYTAIGATVICFWLQMWAQQFTTSSHTAILVSLEPVFAAVTSWYVMNERLGLRALAGAGLIFSGIFLAELLGSGPVILE